MTRYGKKGSSSCVGPRKNKEKFNKWKSQVQRGEVCLDLKMQMSRDLLPVSTQTTPPSSHITTTTMTKQTKVTFLFFFWAHFLSNMTRTQHDCHSSLVTIVPSHCPKSVSHVYTHMPKFNLNVNRFWTLNEEKEEKVQSKHTPTHGRASGSFYLVIFVKIIQSPDTGLDRKQARILKSSNTHSIKQIYQLD